MDVPLANRSYKEKVTPFQHLSWLSKIHHIFIRKWLLRTKEGNHWNFVWFCDTFAFFYVILIFFQPFNCFFLSKQPTDHTQIFRWESSSVTSPWEIDSPVQVVKKSLLIFRNSYRNVLNFIQIFSIVPIFVLHKKTSYHRKRVINTYLKRLDIAGRHVPRKKYQTSLPYLYYDPYIITLTLSNIHCPLKVSRAESRVLSKTHCFCENSKLISITLLVVKLLVLGVYFVQALLNVF